MILKSSKSTCFDVLHFQQLSLLKKEHLLLISLAIHADDISIFFEIGVMLFVCLYNVLA